MNITPEMKTAGEQLQRLIQNNGVAIVHEPGKCKNLLRDYVPSSWKTVLENALTDGLPTRLLSHSNTALTPLLAREAQRLQSSFHLQEDAARWAVETWAVVLGIATAAECEATRPTPVRMPHPLLPPAPPAPPPPSPLVSPPPAPPPPSPVSQGQFQGGSSSNVPLIAGLIALLSVAIGSAAFMAGKNSPREPQVTAFSPTTPALVALVTPSPAPTTVPTPTPTPEPTPLPATPSPVTLPPTAPPPTLPTPAVLDWPAASGRWRVVETTIPTTGAGSDDSYTIVWSYDLTFTESQMYGLGRKVRVNNAAPTPGELAAESELTATLLEQTAQGAFTEKNFRGEILRGTIRLTFAADGNSFTGEAYTGAIKTSSLVGSKQ